MKDTCAVCGRELNGYFDFEFNGQQYKLCENCNVKMKSGKISVNDLSEISADDIAKSIIAEDKRIKQKVNAQMNNPLYDDIHQMTGDIRLLRNIVIIGLIIYVISIIF